jgi:uncharacterized membrane protein YqaE (UPF0057 family)
MNASIKTVRFNFTALFKTGWKIFTSKIKDLIWITLITTAPLLVVMGCYFGYIALASQNESLFDLAFILIFLVALILASFVMVLWSVSITYLTAMTLEGTNVTWKQALSFALSRWGAAIGTGILKGLIVFILMLCLYIPGVMWANYYIFSTYVVALRGLGGQAALDYSKRLVKGQWWSIYGMYLLLAMTVSFAASLLGMVLYPFMMIPTILGAVSPKGTFTVVFAVVYGLLMFVSMILMYFMQSFNHVLLTLFFLNTEAMAGPREIVPMAPPPLQAQTPPSLP